MLLTAHFTVYASRDSGASGHAGAIDQATLLHGQVLTLVMIDVEWRVGGSIAARMRASIETTLGTYISKVPEISIGRV